MCGIAEKRTQRSDLLVKLYRHTGGDTAQWVHWKDWIGLGQALGLTTDQTEAAMKWLIDEMYAEVVSTTEAVVITSFGVEEAEEALDPAPGEPPAPSVVNIQAGSIAAVQTGAHGTANVVQNIGSMPQDIAEAFASLREAIAHLPAAQRHDAGELTDALEALATAEEPKAALVRAFGEQLDTYGPTIAKIVGFILSHILSGSG